MDLSGRAWRGVWRGLRSGEPGVVLGAGVALMALWLRRHPRRRELLGAYELRQGEELTIRLRDPDPEI